MGSYHDTFHTVWGIALVLMGTGFFFRIPHVMEQVATIAYFAPVAVFIRICFYLIGVVLIGGGIKKLYGIWYCRSRANRTGDQ
ncbi:MAG: hypothetical protein R6X08_03445 [Desulfosalsimonadaceae bacterium]